MNATEQAMSVAGNLLGDKIPFAPVPYFWTDQYDTKIQAYGIFPPGAEFQILHGDPTDRRFTAAYTYNDTVVGVIGWNHPRELRRLRPLVAEHADGTGGSGLAAMSTAKFSGLRQGTDDEVFPVHDRVTMRGYRS